MKHDGRKSGFTLVELMVFFVFISLILAASAPIISKRIKHVPDKIQHGKFVCENGGRTQRYYNASQLISTQSVSKCTFKPPVKNSLFKIELVGAGSGGYSYTAWEEDNHKEGAQYSLYPTAGPSGLRSIDPTPTQLLTIFGGANFTMSKGSTSAVKGEDVSISYNGIQQPTITIDRSQCFTPGKVWDPDPIYCDSSSTTHRTVYQSDKDEVYNDFAEDLVTSPYTKSDVGHICYLRSTKIDDGTPEYEDVPKLGEDGQPLKDEKGDIIYESVIKKDEEGNIIYKYEPRYKIEYRTVSKGKYVPKVNDDNLPYCSVWEDAADKVVDRIAAEAQDCSTADECHNVATSERSEKYEGWVKNEVPTGVLSSYTLPGQSIVGEGGAAGKEVYLNLSGKIDFCNYETHPKGCGAGCAGLTDRDASCVQEAEIESYLGSLFTNYYQIGTVSEAGSCEEWGYSEISETDDSTWSSDLNKDSNKGQNWLQGNPQEYQGKKGGDVLHYGAIKGWGQCATNAERATGGEGGIVGTNGSSVWAYAPSANGRVKNGKNASGLVGAVAGPNSVSVGTSSAGMNIPSMSIETTLNRRTHKVGTSGSPGEYKVYYAANLANDCEFKIPYGGGSISGEVPDMIYDSLETSVTCNNGTLRLYAAGGRYSTYVHTFVYDGFNYVDLETGVPNPPSSHVSRVSGGGSPYPSSDVFTKYSINSSSWGYGGDGAEIYDRCTRVFGEYTQSLLYKGAKSKNQHYIIPKEPCDEENEASQVHEYGAGSGGGGAVVITW